MLLWFDQPYFYTTATMDQRWTHVGSCSVSTGVIPRTHTASLGFNFTGFLAKTLGSDGTLLPDGNQAIIGFRFYAGSIYQNIQIVAFQQSARNQVFLYSNPDGTISLYRGIQNGSEHLITSTYSLQANRWYYIELDVTLDATGQVHVYIDNVERLTYAGNTIGLDGNGDPLPATWNGFRFGSQIDGILSYVTDLVVMDGRDGTLEVPAQDAPFNTPLGDVKIEYLGAQSDAVGGVGQYTQWTKSTGTDQGALVDDGAAGPDDLATTLSSSTVGQRFSVNLENLPNSNVEVLAVAPVHSMSKDDAGSREVKPLFYITGGASNPYLGNAVQVPSQGSFRILMMDVFTKNPATGVTWTPTEVNALQVGAEVV